MSTSVLFTLPQMAALTFTMFQSPIRPLRAQLTPLIFHKISLSWHIELKPFIYPLAGTAVYCWRSSIL